MRALICICLAPTIIAASSSSGTVEIDLIFPRKGTWAPADAMPLVFAIQRPDLIPSMAINTISWTLRQVGTRNFYADTVYSSQFDGSSGKPYLFQRAVGNTSGIEGNWEIELTFEAWNCTAIEPRSFSRDGVQIADWNSFSHMQHTIFSEFNTSKSAPSANWTALTSAQNCGNSDGIAFAVTDILKAPAPTPGSGWPGYNQTCAVFGPTTTTSNPCAVTIDAAAASSVSAELSYETCLFQVEASGRGNCTAPRMPSSSDRVTAPWLLVAIVCAIGSAIL
jgi:hypothetical protein